MIKQEKKRSKVIAIFVVAALVLLIFAIEFFIGSGFPNHDINRPVYPIKIHNYK